MSDEQNKDEQNKVQELQNLLLAALQQKHQEPPKKKTKKEKVKSFFSRMLGYIFVKMQEFVHSIDRFINFVVRPHDKHRNEVLQYARPPILFGTYIVIIFVIGGTIWATTAPLDSAAYAIGTVVVSSNKQVIQHPKGGIIKEIFVKQGDSVKQGQAIIQLDETELRASNEIVLNQYRNSLAAIGRLIAERDGLEEIEFDDFLLRDVEILEVEKLIQVQKRLFYSKREGYNNAIASTNKEIDQLRKKIEGHEARKVATSKNLAIITERVNITRDLVGKGFAPKDHLLQLEGEQAKLKASLAEIDSESINAQQEITKCEIKIINIKSQFLESVMKELKESQSQAAELRERYIATKDSLDRVVIRSPVDGIVNELYYHTKGGVIAYNQPIAEITPGNDELIVEAKIPPKNIEAVRVGQKAKMKFSAFKSRSSPVFYGTVASISPDTVVDRQAAATIGATNKMMAGDGHFYVAKINIDMNAFNKYAQPRGLKLIPGMGTEIQIVTGERTFAGYFLDPFRENMFNAFREK